MKDMENRALEMVVGKLEQKKAEDWGFKELDGGEKWNLQYFYSALETKNGNYKVLLQKHENKVEGSTKHSLSLTPPEGHSICFENGIVESLYRSVQRKAKEAAESEAATYREQDLRRLVEALGDC